MAMTLQYYITINQILVQGIYSSLVSNLIIGSQMVEVKLFCVYIQCSTCNIYTGHATCNSAFISSYPCTLCRI